MLEKIIENINTSIENLSIFQKIHGLCVRMQKVQSEEEGEGDTIIFPAEYVQNGELEHVKIDNNKSVFYTRRNGTVDYEVDQDDGDVGCQDIITRSYPIRMVGFVYRCDTDDSYKEEKQVENIIHAVYQSDNRTLATELKIDTIRFLPVTHNVNRYEVIEEEFTGVQITVPFNMYCFYIDWNIIITSQQDCWEDYLCNCNN